MARMPRRPRDPNQLAKFIVDAATSGNAKAIDMDPSKDQAAVELGQRGGRKGGKARALKLTPDQRSEIARIAAAARWKKTGR